MTKQPIKISMVSLGCDKNRVDGERMLGSFLSDSRFKIVQDETRADAVIVNTCAFIDRAKEESIAAILDCCEKNKEGKSRCVIVCGCLAQRYKDEILKELPEVSAVLGLGDTEKIADVIVEAVNGKQISRFSSILTSDDNRPRFLTTPKHLAYIKIAEGCDNHCTYCAIPSIRGQYRSRRIDDICDEAKWLLECGVKELVVVAQDTTYYGTDLYGSSKLPELLEKLSKYPFAWIRVLYCYPERITDSLLSVIASSKNILPYLDIPIQHCNDEILKRMNRKTTKKEISDCIGKIRNKIPNITLRTTLITGFPGETEEQFEELVDFVKEMRFDRLGCFPYSQEEGTPAAKMPGQLPQEVKERRAELIMLEQQRILDQLSEEKKGKLTEVLVEEEGENGVYFGRTKQDAPEIDESVAFVSAFSHKPGDIVPVRLSGSENGTLFGCFEKAL